MRKLKKKPGNRLFGEGGRIAHAEMKGLYRIVTTISVFLLLALPTFSQHNFVLYNNSQLPQANFQNPGQEIWMNGYLILPGLSGASVDLYSDGPILDQMGLRSGFSLDNIVRESLLAENNLSAIASATIAGFGFRHKAGFFHVNLQEHFVSEVYYPKSLFGFIDHYNAETTSLNNYPLYPLTIDAAHYRSYSFGYTHRFAKLSIGAHVKYLQGIANLHISDQNLNILYSKDNSGYSVQGKLEAFTAGVEMYNDPKTGNLIKGSGNSGFAVDLGGVVHFSPKFEMSFAALNLGKVFWKNHIYQTSLLDETTVFQAKDSEELTQELTDNFVSLFDDEIIANSPANYQTLLRQKYLLGARYFFRPATNVGLLLHSDVLDGQANFGGSLSLNTQYKKNVGFSVALSKYQNEDFDIGTGVNFNLGPVQIYAMTDNLISLVSPDKSHKIHGQAGINFIFGKKTRQGAIVRKTAEPSVDPATITPVIVQQEPIIIYPENEFTAKSPEAATEQKQMEKPAETKGLPPGYIEYRAQVSDSESNKPLSDVKVNVYKLKSRRIQVLVHSELTTDGYFALPISRIDTHRVVIEKPGYHKLEKEYSPGLITGKSDTLTLYFFLTPILKDPKLLDIAVESTIAEITDFSKEKTIHAQRSLGTYSLTGSTSLRTGPDHSKSIILRFRTDDEVELLEKTNNYWWKVKYGDLEGFVKATYLVKK